MSINVVLDIDGVLSNNKANTPEKAFFFHNKGAILTAIKTHYLLPGVIELVKLLYNTEGIRVSFFSGGDGNRNRLFVDKLLDLSLPKDQYLEVRERVKILSRNDLTRASYEEKKKHGNHYQQAVGNNQKDLTKVLDEGNLLEETILIDDDPSYVACGQASNLMYIPVTNASTYDKLPRKSEYYQLEGFRLIKCMLSEACTKDNLKRVKQGKLIHVLSRDQSYEVRYLHRESGRVRSMALVESEHRTIIDQLNEAHKDIEKGEQHLCRMMNERVIEEIYPAVEAWGGRTKKICRSANRIFYAAGLLLSVIEEARGKEIAASYALFKRQFKRIGEGYYRPRYESLVKNDDLYLYGLEKLREHNSSLQLTTPHSYVQCLNHPLTEEERSMLVEYIENSSSDDCCIM